MTPPLVCCKWIILYAHSKSALAAWQAFCQGKRKLFTQHLCALAKQPEIFI